MRKTQRFIGVLFTIILSMLSFLFITSCSDTSLDETVTIRVFTLPSNRLLDTDYLPSYESFTQQKGQTFSTAKYFDSVNDNKDNSFISIGFYTDKNCTIKYDDNAIINSDLDLYIVYCLPNTKFVEYIFNECSYISIVQNTNELLNSDSFVLSAYGKPLNKEKLAFFRDKNMMNQITFNNVTYANLDIEEVSFLFGYSQKTIYVKSIS